MSFASLVGVENAGCKPACIGRHADCFSLSSLVLDLAIVITSIVLASLGLRGVIGFPPAACYALFGVGSLFLLADVGVFVLEVGCGEKTPQEY